MPPQNPQVVIIGAGAAGLAAMRELGRAGCSVLCLEARNRIGGRIYTRHDPLLPIPIELGAEFVHGRPREIWDIVDAANLTAYDIAGRAVHIEGGQVRDQGDAWEHIERVMDDMRRAADSGEDSSFQEFIERTSHSEETKRLASAYVESFNAARKETIGIASLAHEARASEQIGGGRSFRILNGYESVPLYLLRGVEDWRAKLRLNAIVDRIQWQHGAVAVNVRFPDGGDAESIHAKCAIVTVPLGVLRAAPEANGAIRFDPEPANALRAARRLAFGQVARIVLRFREAIWRDNEEVADAGFLLSDETRFPTWWTTLPVHANVITGWSAGPRSDDLLGKPKAEIVAEAVAALARITGQRRERLESLLEQAYYHDWYSDPFARGAYSYAPAGALGARDALAEPVEDTLFFAGEAAETGGHGATVHGAIMSGKRAARQAIESLE
ncbi:MAG: flavin monoamine oxidase family protein [Bryobacteraceae bacterium]